MSRIDEKTTVPLGWVAAGLCVMFPILTAGCFWVFSVNERLGRIEAALSIKNHEVAVR